MAFQFLVIYCHEGFICLEQLSKPGRKHLLTLWKPKNFATDSLQMLLHSFTPLVSAWRCNEPIIILWMEKLHCVKCDYTFAKALRCIVKFVYTYLPVFILKGGPKSSVYFHGVRDSTLHFDQLGLLCRHDARRYDSIWRSRCGKWDTVAIVSLLQLVW